jgi:hypothetical protein
MINNEMNIVDKEGLIAQILYKFDMLFDKEEYYNHQERVYKLNKAFSSISKAHNLSVTNFSENLEKTQELKRRSSSNLQEAFGKLEISLENLSQILDGLLEKKDEDKNYLISSSSSEDEKTLNLNTLDVSSMSNKKRKLLKNLYNYELLLKAYFFEKSLSLENVSENQKQLLEDFGGNVTPSNFSTNNMTNESTCRALKNENEDNSLLYTPISKISNHENMSAKTYIGTPLIKKSFFEDKEIKKCLNKRRRSLRDEHLCGQGSTLLQEQRRRSHIFEKIPLVSLSHSNKRSGNCLQSNSEENNENEGGFNDNIVEEISNFNINLFSENQMSTIDTQSKFQEKRCSIFIKEKENFLTNITENEEFYGSLSLSDKSFSDSEEENKNV